MFIFFHNPNPYNSLPYIGDAFTENGSKFRLTDLANAYQNFFFFFWQKRQIAHCISNSSSFVQTPPTENFITSKHLILISSYQHNTSCWIDHTSKTLIKSKRYPITYYNPTCLEGHTKIKLYLIIKNCAKLRSIKNTYFSILILMFHHPYSGILSSSIMLSWAEPPPIHAVEMLVKMTPQHKDPPRYSDKLN